MTVNTSAAYGMYPHNAPLHHVMHTLSQSGFNKEDICMMVSPKHAIATVLRQASIFNTEPDSNAITAGLMGWLLEFGAVMIPSVGFFIRSQAFLRALVTNNSSGLCGSSRTLVGLGFPESDAERFESQLREVGVLVYVACQESARAAWAVEVLRRTGAREPARLETEMAAEAAA